jgi:DNA-binding NarL/FixJ family response regulator
MTPRLNGLRVLLVEDEAITAYYLELLLVKAGCEVIGPIQTLARAMDQVAVEQFDAVLLDVNLNGEWSYPIADVLLRRGLPFLFMTAYGSSQLPEPYRSLTCCQKSWGPDRLLEALALVVASRGFNPASTATAGERKPG